MAPREFTHWCFGCCSCGARAFCIAKWWGKADRWWMNKVSSSYMSTQSLPLVNTPPAKQPKIAILFHGGPLCELRLSFTLKVQDLCREIDSSLPPSLISYSMFLPLFEESSLQIKSGLILTLTSERQSHSIIET